MVIFISENVDTFTSEGGLSNTKSVPELQIQSVALN